MPDYVMGPGQLEDTEPWHFVAPLVETPTLTPVTIPAVPVYSAIPGAAVPAVTPTPAAAVSPASSLMPLLLVGAVLWFITK